MTNEEGLRERSPIDDIADRYFDDMAAMSPILLTELGSAERQDEYDDFSPAGLRAHRDLAASTLDLLAPEQPRDLVDAVTKAAMRERLALEIELHDSGAGLLSLNGIASGLHAIRSVYDQMPQGTLDQWATIARRLRAVPPAIAGWFESQQAAIDLGVRPAQRQVRLLVEQVRSWVADGGFFDDFLATARLDGEPLPEQVQADLAGGVAIARGAFEGAADRLEADVLPQATATDAVGRERYLLHSREFLGSVIDLEETYQWGRDELARIEQMMRDTAERIRPGASIDEAIEILNADPAYQLHGTDALREWMQARADEAIAELSGVHFDIPEPVRRIEACIAPTHDGGIYYTGPSEDFSRPGRMWWSVPEGEDSFGTWSELTTVYHEGVPGHHLQIAQTAARSDLLNRWRRFGAWVSGNGEGWALYAEWLMGELGFMDDPGNRMGLLDSQRLRATRVVLDIGVHCGFEAPEEVGGGEWTFDKAWDFFNAHVAMSEGQARFEVNRYFGWPGQAPAYKIGQRLWLGLREEVRDALGDAFDLKQFHRTALDIGAVGLDVLRAAVLDALVPAEVAPEA
ncbi:MAG TPA: DUF885 domain-containing protein [Propionibacteriaceae bacterium]|nr:DUF885 domain-containing protein [Propionibacteriaceae bacterium]